MDIIVNVNDFFDRLDGSMHGARKCYISSYSIYAGITWEGKCVVTDYGYDNRGYEFLNALREKEIGTSLIVGLPMLIECVDGCKHCRRKQQQQVVRTELHTKEWGEFEWIVCRDHHAKYIIFDNYDCYIGGRNVTESNYFDLSFFINSEKLFQQLKKIHQTKVDDWYRAQVDLANVRKLDDKKETTEIIRGEK